MSWLHDFWNFAAQTLLGELLTVIAGIFISQLISMTWEKWRYGGWTVQILNVVDGRKQEILQEEIPPAKAKELLNDPVSLRIYLKGLVSSYTWLRCDLLTKGRETGLFREDREQRRFIIDLSKNPPGSRPPAEAA